MSIGPLWSASFIPQPSLAGGCWHPCTAGEGPCCPSAVNRYSNEVGQVTCDTYLIKPRQGEHTPKQGDTHSTGCEASYLPIIKCPLLLAPFLGIDMHIDLFRQKYIDTCNVL